MFKLYRPVLQSLRRTLESAREELSLLEADLGLCAHCGNQPPPPLGQRAQRPQPALAIQAAQRRVA